MNFEDRQQVRSTVYAVDDDPNLQEMLRGPVLSSGLDYAPFESGREFLSRIRPDVPSCVVMEDRLADVSGLELLKELQSRGDMIPVIFLTGHATVQSAVSALNMGAIDYLEKPIAPQVVLDRIHRAIAADARNRLAEVERGEAAKQFAQLSRGEEEVLERIVAGMSNKKMAAELDLTERTIEYRKAGLMKKFGAGSIVDVIRKAICHQCELMTRASEGCADRKLHIHAGCGEIPSPHQMSQRDLAEQGQSWQGNADAQ